MRDTVWSEVRAPQATDMYPSYELRGSIPVVVLLLLLRVD
jgi:hypothetical protein